MKKKSAYNQGLTFLEVVIALSLFAVAIVGYLQIVDVALQSCYRASQELIAANLARGLMAEIIGKKFAEEKNSQDMGPDSGETDRWTGFDDVDDYDGWYEAPPQALDGTVMDGTAAAPNYARFSRGVRVQFVNVAFQVTPYYSPYKKVTVWASGPQAGNVTIVEIKTNEYDG